MQQNFDCTVILKWDKANFSMVTFWKAPGCDRQKYNLRLEVDVWRGHTCTSRLVVQHPCQVSFKSMQGCRRSWEDKLKCVKILSVKDHNSAKICGTWIISPHALLDLWCNIPAKFHSNPCKDVGGVEKTS